MINRPSPSSTRRATVLGLSAAALAACTTSPTNAPSRREAIDRRVDQALAELFAEVPGAADLAQQAEGILIIPRIATAGLIVGGAYGEGALMVGRSEEHTSELQSREKL